MLFDPSTDFETEDAPTITFALNTSTGAIEDFIPVFCFVLLLSSFVLEYTPAWGRGCWLCSSRQNNYAAREGFVISGLARETTSGRRTLRWSGHETNQTLPSVYLYLYLYRQTFQDREPASTMSAPSGLLFGKLPGNRKVSSCTDTSCAGLHR